MQPDLTTDSRITRIAAYIPRGRVTNDDLAREHPDWEVDRVSAKTGVYSRAVAPADWTSGDLGVAAGEALFALDPDAKDRVDFLIFCTQTPDYFLPSTSCIVQDRLGLPSTVGAIDLNLGCSGHVYGLSMAKGLIETGQAAAVLLITAETYTHIIHPADRSVRSLFGDAGAATLIEGTRGRGAANSMRGFTFGSDGGGSRDLILRAGGFRDRQSAQADRDELDAYISMNGQGVFNFTRRRIPAAVTETLSRAGATLDEIDLVVFHQASRLVIDSLQRALQLPDEKCWFGIEEIGNTVSSTIPIALAQAAATGRLKAGDQVLLAGFGVGLSWACAVIRWDDGFSSIGV